MVLPDFPRPLTTVDVAIFSIRAGRLAVLLVRRPADAGAPFPRRWALPGGFVDIERDRDLEACALRKLREKTGLAAPYLEQVGSWGNARRDPRGWSSTHVYFALVPEGVAAAPDGEAQLARPVRGQLAPGVQRAANTDDHDLDLVAVHLDHPADRALRDAPLAGHAIHPCHHLGAVRKRNRFRIDVLESLQSEVGGHGEVRIRG